MILGFSLMAVCLHMLPSISTGDMCSQHVKSCGRVFVVLPEQGVQLINLYDGIADSGPGRQRAEQYRFQVQSLKDIDGGSASLVWFPLRPWMGSHLALVLTSNT